MYFRYTSEQLACSQLHSSAVVMNAEVELDMCMSILADCTELDEEYLRRKRAESVERAKRTNGQAVLMITAFQLDLFLRREIDRQFVLFAHFLLLPGV